MSYASYTFTHAIVREPGNSILDGLRAVDTGTPNLSIFKQHHNDYIDALKSTGATVIQLDANEDFPDSVFVEDSALCLPEGAISMRPGATTRFGEAALMHTELSSFYSNVVALDGPGHVEGGDILCTENEVLVGLSARTDVAGVNALRTLLENWGHTLRIVDTPAEILHFKTDCSLLDEETILCTKRLAATGCFDNYRVIHTADGEEACANAIRFNELVIMPAGFPKTQELLEISGYKVNPVGNSEAAKLDGGMSCLSLRFTPG
ncbi:arginine deiminase family protein [Granulosicoccus sp.]|nr:arginine deiminase family protein [Granulosicoccus sp.]MDB4224417.1 arginine deiminase family protein [Granulosicoccus sp.]